MAKRAPSTPSAGSGWKIDSSATYYAEVYALHKDIADSIRANADAPLDMDRDATEWLTLQALIQREITWASNYFTTAIWSGHTGTAGTDVTGVAGTPSTNQVLQWNDDASTPVHDVKEEASLIQSRTGIRPNTLVLGRQVVDALTEHPDIIDRIKYTAGPGAPAIVTLQALAGLFGLDRVLVSDAVKCTSNEKQAFESSMTMAYIAGKAALLQTGPCDGACRWCFRTLLAASRLGAPWARSWPKACNCISRSSAPTKSRPVFWSPWLRSGSRPRPFQACCHAIRTLSQAVSDSASHWPVRSWWSPNCWCSTSPPVRWM